MPKALKYLFQMHQRLRGRKAAGFGIQPWEWPDLDAFVRLNRITLLPWETEILEVLDNLFLAARNGKLPDPTEED